VVVVLGIRPVGIAHKDRRNDGDGWDGDELSVGCPFKPQPLPLSLQTEPSSSSSEPLISLLLHIVLW